MRILLIFIGFLTITGCRTSNIAGTYRSNCADIGFFVTTVKLNSDSTFEYNFRGDLVNESGKGTYEVNNGIVDLTFIKQPIKRTEYWIREDSSGNIDTVYYNIDEIFNPPRTEPLTYKLGNNKLWIINKYGKVVKRANCYSRTRKFLFWGDKFTTTRKYYLDKTE